MKMKFENSIYIYVFISAVLLACVALLLIINDSIPPSPDAVIPRTQLPTDANKIEYVSKLAPGFPAFPVYPGSVLENSYKTKNAQAGKEGLEAYWETSAPVPEVMDWYLKELAKGGWTIDESPSDPETVGEQAAQVSKNNLHIYLDIEQTGPTNTEIYVSIPETPIESSQQ